MTIFKQGDRVGEYIISRKVGHGKFSDVYAANKVMDGITDPVLKCIKVQRNNEDSRETSKYEIEFLTEIKNTTPGHPHIITLIDSFEHAGLLCIVYDLMGCDLIDFIADKFPNGMPYEYAKQIMMQLFGAVSFLHKQGLIHTDIKPDNILLTKCPEDINSVDDIHIILADFGTVIKYDANDKDYSDHMQTPEYQAPEIIIGHEYDQKIDIWSCICTFYELLSGKYLFNPADIGDGESDYGDYSSDEMDDISNRFEESNLSDEASDNLENDKNTAMSIVDDDCDDESDDEEDKMINLIHLYHMDRLLGEMPESLISGGHYAGYYFTCKNKLRGDLHNNNEDLSLRSVLKTLQLGGDYNRVYDIFVRGLQYIPENRADADSLLTLLTSTHQICGQQKIKPGKGRGKNINGAPGKKR